MREIFAATPIIRFKVDAFQTHAKSSLHASALESELTQKVSVFHKEVNKKLKEETKKHF